MVTLMVISSLIIASCLAAILVLELMKRRIKEVTARSAHTDSNGAAENSSADSFYDWLKTGTSPREK